MGRYTWVLLLMSWRTAIICCNCNNIECLPKERLILLRFNTEVGRLSVSWKGFNCCEWDGVECSNLTSHVTQLRLSNLLLQSSSATQTLAPLFKLKQLEYLDISSNGFTGVIPAGISLLKELKHLDMGNNSFEGEIPLPLGNLSDLQYLDISMTEKNGFKCWSNLEWALSLPNLQNLSVKYVAVTSSGKELGNYISALHNLQFLDMSNTQISGPIPTAILNLTSLTHLDFHGNNFSSPLPLWLGNLTSLEWLSFYRCNLSGPFPLTLSTLPHLKYLRMADNEFLSGDISEILGSGWPQLTLFTLSGSHIRGQIPASIGNLSSLTDVTVVETKINGLIPASVGNLSLIEELILRNNLLTGRIPPSLRRLSKLTTLDLSYNQLSGNIPSWLDGHSALRKLYLQSNKLTGAIPTSLGHLSHIEVIDLSSNSLQGNFSLQVFQNTSSLVRLHFSYNQLTVDLNPGWVPKIQFQVLGLASCNIGGSIPTFLLTQHRLLGLDLSNNSLVGSIPSWLWDLKVANYLNLSYNILEGRLPPILSVTLLTVDLRNNRLSGPLPLPSPSLQVLDLSHNDFTGVIPSQIGSIPPQLGNLSHLHVLDLSQNNLSGSIPPELEKLASGMAQVESSTVQSENGTPAYYKEEISVANKETKLVYVDSILLLITCIDLSANQLSGIIPPTIGTLNALHILNISRNNLSGEIPHTFGMLEQIESLDLSYNKLKGKIPMEMQNLHFLAVSIMSNNRLCGKIPTEGQFSTFNDAYFYGNPCLCGFPLDIRCPGSPGIISAGNNEDNEEEEGTKYPWYWYVSCMATFAIGFWGLFALLCARRTWRTRCINTLDEAVISFSDLFTMH
ncbi:hypothetical protein SUGI_0853250 [Cryptomeria japonica]|nr:hypothetical protein SUGI_0853250 [Cryptomeria japonica]